MTQPEFTGDQMGVGYTGEPGGRTFFFQLGRVVMIWKASGSNAGAMMHSMNRLGSVIKLAVATSTARLNARMPPKALTGSPA